MKGGAEAIEERLIGSPLGSEECAHLGEIDAILNFFKNLI